MGRTLEIGCSIETSKPDLKDVKALLTPRNMYYGLRISRNDLVDLKRMIFLTLKPYFSTDEKEMDYNLREKIINGLIKIKTKLINLVYCSDKIENKERTGNLFIFTGTSQKPTETVDENKTKFEIKVAIEKYIKDLIIQINGKSGKPCIDDEKRDHKNFVAHDEIEGDDDKDNNSTEKTDDKPKIKEGPENQEEEKGKSKNIKDVLKDVNKVGTNHDIPNIDASIMENATTTDNNTANPETDNQTEDPTKASSSNEPKKADQDDNQ
ncbi:hypothetical protein DMENIID0001_092610 [Sergentomyia squamirostris]